MGVLDKMRKIDNVFYYTSGDVAAICNKTMQTVNNWDKYSDILEERGENRLIPKAIRINGRRLYTKEQVASIKEFSKNVPRGTMAEYSRTRMGKRGEEIQKRIDSKRDGLNF